MVANRMAFTLHKLCVGHAHTIYKCALRVKLKKQMPSMREFLRPRDYPVSRPMDAAQGQGNRLRGAISEKAANYGDFFAELFEAVETETCEGDATGDFCPEDRPRCAFVFVGTERFFLFVGFLFLAGFVSV